MKTIHKGQPFCDTTIASELFAAPVICLPIDKAWLRAFARELLDGARASFNDGQNTTSASPK